MRRSDFYMCKCVRRSNVCWVCFVFSGSEIVCDKIDFQKWSLCFIRYWQMSDDWVIGFGECRNLKTFCYVNLSGSRCVRSAHSEWYENGKCNDDTTNRVQYDSFFGPFGIFRAREKKKRNFIFDFICCTNLKTLP